MYFVAGNAVDSSKFVTRLITLNWLTSFDYLLQAVLQLTSSFYYQCTHQHVCHPRCFRRQMRSCFRMLSSVRKVYGDEPHLEAVEFLSFPKKPRNQSKEDTKKEKGKGPVSRSASPIKRRESMAKKDRYLFLTFHVLHNTCI